MSHIKPLNLYYMGRGPNPWKVAIILEELNLPYNLIPVKNVKSEEFVRINPNGRVPALEDPNTGITTWESASNIDYLIDTYDQENKLSYSSLPEKALQRNWEHFQMSGQGPYYGQQYHPEKIQSAIDRYTNEVDRILSVIELHLSRTGQSYLVGDKCTYADLMWVPWNDVLGLVVGPEFEQQWKAKHPKCHDWHLRLMARDGVKRMEARKAKEL